MSEGEEDQPTGRQSTPRPLSDSGFDDEDPTGGGDASGSIDAVLAVQHDARLVAEVNAMQCPGPSFDGPVSVVNSTCQFGGNTFYHGPVTVVLPEGREDDGVVLAEASTEASTPGGLEGARAVAVPGEGSKEAAPRSGSKGGRGSGKVWRSLRQWQRVMLVGGLVLVLAAIGLAAALLGGQWATDAPAVTPSPDGNTDYVVNGLVSRRGWSAQAPRITTPLTTPVKMVIVHHTATSACSEEPVCQTNVHDMQLQHMYTNGWNDIAYNFLVGGDGFSYEGRGWDAQGAHTKFWNERSVGVALIGNFCSTRMPTRQLEALKRLLRLGEALGKLSSDYALLGRCQVGSAISPGYAAMVDIETLSHWTDGTNSTLNFEGKCLPCGPVML